MIVRFLAIPAGDRILCCFQLHNHTGETLGERIMNVARHSISFFENRGPLTLFGKLIELKGKHDLVGRRLGQFNLFWPLSCPVAMTNANKAPDLSTHQKRHCEKPLCAVSFQVLTPITVNARISVDVTPTPRTCREQQFLNYCVLLPE